MLPEENMVFSNMDSEIGKILYPINLKLIPKLDMREMIKSNDIRHSEPLSNDGNDTIFKLILPKEGQFLIYS